MIVEQGLAGKLEVQGRANVAAQVRTVWRQNSLLFVGLQSFKAFSCSDAAHSERLTISLH